MDGWIRTDQGFVGTEFRRMDGGGCMVWRKTGRVYYLPDRTRPLAAERMLAVCHLIDGQATLRRVGGAAHVVRFQDTTGVYEVVVEGTNC